MAQSTVESKNKKGTNNGKIPAKETILSPRFYTTDFEAMENMDLSINCLLYTSPSPRDPKTSRMPSSA